VHSPAKLTIDLFSAYGGPLLTDRFTQNRKLSLPGLTAYMRKAQKVKCLRFALSPFRPTLGRKTTKFNEPGFVRVQLQTELQKALAQFVEEPLCFRAVLESDDEVIRKTDDDNLFACQKKRVRSLELTNWLKYKNSGLWQGL
jgi:hypothetical protein